MSGKSSSATGSGGKQGGGVGEVGGGGGGAVTASRTADVLVDWRLSVQQSYRNVEVREIAKVLASLEPGCTKDTTKLSLAMQFEDVVYKSASSLTDYHKRLTKRLKKLQKNYEPIVLDENTKENVTREREMNELRQQYKTSIQYIIQHANSAIMEMNKKDSEKANQLKQHTDGVLLWANDLGIDTTITDSTSTSSNTVHHRTTNNNNKPNYTISLDQLKKLKEQLERRLENIRCHVVRLVDPDQYLAELLEKVEKQYSTSTTTSTTSTSITPTPTTSTSSSTTTTNTVTIAAEYSRRLYEHVHKTSMDVPKFFKTAWEQVNQKIPLPTRNQQVQNQKQQQKQKIALLYLEKMRAGTNVLFGYLMMKDKKMDHTSSSSSALSNHNNSTTTTTTSINTTTGTTTTLPKNTLVKTHQIVIDGIHHVQDVMNEYHKINETKKKTYTVTLQDAWMKPLLLLSSSIPSEEIVSPNISTTTGSSTGIGKHDEVDVVMEGGIDNEDITTKTTTGIENLDSSSTTAFILPAVKRRKLNSNGRVVLPLRSRVLMNPNRKIPSSILLALQRKRVTLIRPPPIGDGTYLKLVFDEAFIMYIYFVPLLVSIRAYHPPTHNNNNNNKQDHTPIDQQKESSLSGYSSEWKRTPWIPLHVGLTDENQDPIPSTTTSTTTTSAATTTVTDTNNNNATSSTNQQSSERYHVWGIKGGGTYETVGDIIQERLRDASAQATQTLRQCFMKHVPASSTSSLLLQNEFEIEIYEATALLEFLHLARTTYVPNWEDDDT